MLMGGVLLIDSRKDRVHTCRAHVTRGSHRWVALLQIFLMKHQDSPVESHQAEMIDVPASGPVVLPSGMQACLGFLQPQWISEHIGSPRKPAPHRPQMSGEQCCSNELIVTSMYRRTKFEGGL
ncbi:hypothetical protein WJX74_001285 [Apatococcus lobatus]|uniref:Uncharacterized protein n=1 Tax=Apatococcus lobatus TaxID=904363 RepID=A0AAW1RH04_9CHLO